MIALNEPNAYAAEILYFLASKSSPLVGVTLHDFSNNGVTGEVKLALPSGSFFNTPASQILEKGFGWYAVRLLTPSQVALAGIASVYCVTSDAEPDYVGENIGTAPGGDIAVLGTGVIPFFLPNAANPIYGAPITGHVFVLGEVQICLPNTVGFVNVPLASIVEFGNGGYGVKVDSTMTVNRGKAILHVDIGASSQPFGDSITILGNTSSGTSVSTGTGAVVSPVASPYTPSSAAYRDHTAAAISRLCEQFKQKAA